MKIKGLIMVGIEDVPQLEGMWAPLDVRRGLRQMFRRWLPTTSHLRSGFGQVEMFDEIELLDFCQHYRLEYFGAAKDIAKIWDESKERIADGGPTFSELTRLGWIVFDGGRWIMQCSPPGTLSHITYPSPSTEKFLHDLSKIKCVEKTSNFNQGTQKLAAKILDEQLLEQYIPTNSSNWLAGRIWERLCAPLQLGQKCDNSLQASNQNGTHDSLGLWEEVDRAFLEWSAWCQVLGVYVHWDTGWRESEARYCREAANRILERQALWGSWENDIPSYIEILEKTFAIPKDQLRFARVPRVPPPSTLVSKADWFARIDVEHIMMERLHMEHNSSISFAYCLLCSELEKIDIGPGITSSLTTFLSFTLQHPMALRQYMLRINAAPELLVDMLMHPKAACLATKLAIEWWPESGRNSDRNINRDAQMKAFAVQDSLSFLAYHLSNNSLDLEEFAALITWCYSPGTGRRRSLLDSRRSTGRQLLGMVAKESEETQALVLQNLISQVAYENNVPRARFAGVLDGINCLSNTLSVDTLPVVAVYSKFARDLSLDWTDTSDLSSELAAQLVKTAFAQSVSDRDAFLIPLDSAQLMRAATDDERPSLHSSIANTLREHVRLLARAVAGWPEEDIPSELFNSLKLLISRTVIEHAEKGRVGALTDRYSPSNFLVPEDGSPARDLAAAWRKLDSRYQEDMLQLFIQSDDPVLLSELCQHLPAVGKSTIQSRLRQLGPGEASTFWTWPELQHRIESLLLAGEYSLAREHLNDVESDLDSAPSQYRFGLFSLELQLLMKERKWTAIDNTALPVTLDKFTARQAQNQLDFYRATSQLLRPDGNLTEALAVLQRLAAIPGSASAYKENIFAVAIQQLLGPTLHPLTGDNKSTGENLLAEINAVVNVNEELASSSLLANRALLMLALQRPEQAVESVANRRREMRSANIEHVVVLAKYEMGHKDEAMAILDAAIIEFGDDDQLIALRNNLQSGQSPASIASASVDVDLISSIRAALQQLSELPPSLVGNILGPTGRGVQGYLIRQVSRAVASLQHMAAMLRDRKNTENKAKFEDDLNSAVREVLGASFSVAKWDVADQSLGGSTSNGNPGERDAVIRVSGQEIAIYEALVCSRLERTNIKKHFDKLLSYGICETYFHVTYSYAKKIKPLLEYVGYMLEYEAPSDLIYLRCESLGPPDYETCGYVATYRIDHREVSVVFLVADLALRI
ncbi:TPA: hypothetical protein NPM25_002668 [Enterobacter hormaechei]|nr:hypothetical protein [Enterobacter hormaechei]